VAVKELPYDQSSAWLEDALDLPQRRSGVGDLTEGRHQVGGVEAVIVIREFPRVRPCRDNRVDSPGRRATRDVIEHGLLDVDDVQSPVGAQQVRDMQGLQAGARPDLKDPLPRPGSQQRVEPTVGEEWQRQVKQPALRVGVWCRIGPPPGGDGGRGGRRDKDSALHGQSA
jgi:hypothetical protein